MSHTEGLIQTTAPDERSLRFEIGPSRAETFVVYTHPPDAAEDGVKQIYDLAIEHLLAARERLPEGVLYDHEEVKRANKIIAVAGRLVALRQDQVDHPSNYPTNIDFSILLCRVIFYGDDQFQLMSLLKNEAHLVVGYPEVTRLRNSALHKLSELDTVAYTNMLDVLEVDPNSREYPYSVISAMRKPFEAHETRVVAHQSETLFI